MRRNVFFESLLICLLCVSSICSHAKKMPPQQVKYKTHRFDFDSSILEKDSTCIDVRWRIEDCTTDSFYMIAHTACTEWLIPVKNGRIDTVMTKGILCLPPIAPRGKSLFALVRVYMDQSKNVCEVRCKVKALKTPGIFTGDDGRYSPLPSKKEWKSGKWCGPITFQDGTSVLPGYKKYKKRK